MKIINNKKLLMTLGVSAMAVSMSAQSTYAASCTFSRSLYVGVSSGSDVQCLQEYLNAQGHTIAAFGGGSPGNETTRFGGLTKAAVLKWQRANGVSGANGVFGPRSQTMYRSLTTGSTTSTTPTTNTGSVSTVNTNSALIDRIHSLIKSAIIEIENTRKLIDASSKNTDEAEKEYNKATGTMFDSVFALFDEKYAEAVTKAGAAINEAKAAQAEIGSSSSSSSDVTKTEAKKALDDAEDEIKDAKKKIGRC